MQDGSGISSESNVGDVMISNFFDKHSEPPIDTDLAASGFVLRRFQMHLLPSLIETFDWRKVLNVCAYISIKQTC